MSDPEEPDLDYKSLEARYHELRNESVVTLKAVSPEVRRARELYFRAVFLARDMLTALRHAGYDKLKEALGDEP